MFFSVGSVYSAEPSPAALEYGHRQLCQQTVMAASGINVIVTTEVWISYQFHGLHYAFSLNFSGRAGEVAQQLGALAAVLEFPCIEFPETHPVVHNCACAPAPEDPVPSSGLHRHLYKHGNMAYTHTYSKSNSVYVICICLARGVVLLGGIDFLE